jgi:hypothetical protein
LLTLRLQVLLLLELLLQLSSLEVPLESALIEWFGVLERRPVTHLVRLAVSPGAIPGVVTEVDQALNRLRHILRENYIEAFDIYIHCVYSSLKNQKSKQMPATVAGQPIGLGEFLTQ